MDLFSFFIQLGESRLERSRKGADFFQEVPTELVGEDVLGWYLKHFGRIINTDCAKLAFLKDGYLPSNPESVAEFHGQASRIVQQLVDFMLGEVDETSRVVFMAGGNGSGKSTFCNGARAGLSEKDWIIDATLASYEPAARTMQRLLEKGVRTALVFIDRPMDDAWANGVLKRAVHGSHRTPRSVFDSTHATVPRNVERLLLEFPAIQPSFFHICNDRGGQGHPSGGVGMAGVAKK